MAQKKEASIKPEKPKSARKEEIARKPKEIDTPLQKNVKNGSITKQINKSKK